MAEGTWVGLDVHARKVVAGVLDAASGELRSLRAAAASLRSGNRPVEEGGRLSRCSISVMVGTPFAVA